MNPNNHGTHPYKRMQNTGHPANSVNYDNLLGWQIQISIYTRPCNDDENGYEYVYYVRFDPNHYKADARAIITSNS